MTLLGFFDTSRGSTDSLFSVLLFSDEAGYLIAADVEFDFERGLLLLGRVRLDVYFFVSFPLPLALHVENF